MKLSKIFVLFAICTFNHLYATDVRFFSTNELYDISIRETRTICEDETGFIWTSSKSGVLRVSKNNYRIYQLPYTLSDILSVNITYKNSVLLAYTSNGQIFKYDELHDDFKLFLDVRKIVNNSYVLLNQVLIDNSGIIWVATSEGLFRYNDKVLKLISKHNISVRKLELKNNDLLYATKFELFKVNTKTLTTVLIYEIKGLDKSIISKLYYEKRSDKLWIGTISSGLFYIDFKTKSVKGVSVKNFPRQPILAITENTDSTLLVGIDGQGIWEVDLSGNKVLNIFKENVDNPYSINGDGVYDLYCDQYKRIWVSTYSGGLSYYDQESSIVSRISHKINNPNSLGNNSVNDVLQDKRGNIWFATNNGISRWRIASNQWDRFLNDTQTKGKAFLALCEDNDGNVWCGSYSSGIYVLNGTTGKEINHFSETTKNVGIVGKFVFAISKDSNGDIWIGGNQGGILCYLTKEKRFISYDASFDIKKIVELSKGVIIVASSYGLLEVNKSSGKFKTLLTKYIIQDILLMGDKIWLGTRGAGLLCFDYKSGDIKNFTTDNGIPSNYINSLIEINGNIWMGSEKGLCWFDPKQEKVLTLSSEFSLTNLSFNSGVKKLQNGNIIWGSSNGAVIFDPNEAVSNVKNGKLFIQDILIAGQSIRDNAEIELKTPIDKIKNITLKYFQNTLSVEMLSVGDINSGVKYSWKLVGIDSEWTSPIDYPMINYANLPDGNFQLKIKMLDSSLSSIIDERVLDVRITPPFWDTWWFKLIISISIIGLLYSILRFYTNKLRRQHTEDKINFFTNTAHDIRTSITLISAPVTELKREKSLSEKGKYYLNLASEQIGRLSFVATQLLDFQKIDIGKGQLFLVMTDIVNLVRLRKSFFEPLAMNKNVHIEFRTNCESYMTAVDEIKMEKVIDNLISNAIKFSNPKSSVEISLECNPENWILEVKDYGLGISENAKKKLFREFYRGDNAINSKIVGSGIGLLLVKNYVTMLQGEVQLKSKENEGSTFKIIIPFKEVEQLSTLQDDTEKDIEEDIIESSYTNQFDDINLDSTASNKKTQLLLVEDNNNLQNFLESAFQDQYIVTTSNNGAEALEAVKKKMPDIVISDVMMPVMDGFEFCRIMKSTFETSHIPIILLTALSDKTQQLEGLGLGADDYITKPFDMTLLRQRMTTIVRNREIIREKAVRLFRYTENEQPILNNELNNEFVRKALEIVRKNISNCGFGKDEFAAAINVSSSLLYKKIKSLTGQSPVDFIKTIRLDYSIELLQSGKYSITEISELCGFSSVGYFSTVFKKHYGKPPTEINS